MEVKFQLYSLAALPFDQKALSTHSKREQVGPRAIRDKILTLRHWDLNALCSGCLPEFFLGFFKFQCMLLKKKLYLIDFSFKFNEIKFCTLLMNWLIREKIFTYFYNKFRPLNRMHYIESGVNSSSLTQFWLLWKVSGTLDRCFITTHIIQNEGYLQIYFCVIFLKTRHNAQAHVTSGALIDCALSLAMRRTQMAAELGWFHWPVLVMATFESQNIFCART